MNLNKCARPAIRVLIWFTIILATASIASAGWKEKVLYSFQGGLNDGAGPAGGVVFDKAGNLYGTTTGGGPDSCAPIGNACGLVYQLSPPVKQGDPWTETIIFQFKGKGANDASAPSGGVILDSAGNLYGVTAYGGTGDCVLLGTKAGCGTVFELSPPAQKGGPWTETILYSFKSGKEGYFPWGDLTFDGKGNLYGVTDFGGGKGTTCNVYYEYCGTVFKLSPPRQKGGSWTEQVLHSFRGGKDGANPNGGLILDKQGVIYATTQTGGSQGCVRQYVSVGCGTVFELTPPRRKGGIWGEKQLHVFTGSSDGNAPNGNLVADAGGSLYGTAGGGALPFGVVFRLSQRKPRSQWSETVLHNFTGGKDGRGTAGPVTFDTNGSLYGTVGPGPYYGAVFRLAPRNGQGDWNFSTVYNFKGVPDGSFPAYSLVFDSAGNLYGITVLGGSGSACSGGCGSAFEVSP
jgi:hypothetical protein